MRVRWLSLLLVLVLGCSPLGESSSDEVARVRAPSGTVDAVVMETNGGATTSFGYEVCVVVAGAECTSSQVAARFYAASRSEDAYGVNARWTGPNALRIEYLEAEQASLPRPKFTAGGRAVSVALGSGVTDSSAPAGGMLYNLQGRPHDVP